MRKPPQSICPNGHRPPRVQFLKDEGIYCCLACGITWRQVLQTDAKNLPGLVSAGERLGIKIATRESLRSKKP